MTWEKLPAEAKAYLATRGLYDAQALNQVPMRYVDGRIWLGWPNLLGAVTYQTGAAINGLQPKYLHQAGPKPPLYATPGAWEVATVAVCEGQIDALLAYQAGTPAFATSGSHISGEAVQILARKETVILISDRDAAGERWLETLTSQLSGVTRLKQVQIPDLYKDLGEYAQDAADPIEDIAKLINQATMIRRPDDIYIDWDQFWDTDQNKPEWLYEDILAWGRSHAIYARHKVGKSLLCLWLALQLTQAGHVVIYLDYEMTTDDLQERLQDMGIGPDTDLDRLRYALLPTLPPLDTKAGAEMLLDIIDKTQAQHPQTHVAIIIDTTTRALAGEENSADTIRDYYRHTGLGIKQRGHTLIRLDHAGKDTDRGQRGSSAKGDDVDIVWRLEPCEGGLQLKREATRLGWIPERVTLHQTEDPLQYITVTDAYPAGTKDCAQELDQLGIPPTATQRQAKQAIKDAGIKRRAAVIQAAQRYRRDTQNEAQK